MRPAPWIAGLALAGAAAVTVVGARVGATSLVAGWRNEVESVVRAREVAGVRVQIDGRTLRIEGEIDDPVERAALVAALGRIEGITSVEDRTTRATRPQLPPPDPIAAPDSVPPAAPEPAPRAKRPARPSPCQGELKALFRGDVIRFDSFSSVIPPESEPLLEDVAEIMAKCPGTVLEIAGHTDGQGSPELKESLSLARAEVVRQHLIQLGIEPARLVAMGFGDREPIDDDSTETGRMRNRRIEMRLREGR